MDSVYINIISLLLGWVFLSAAWHKLRRPDLFCTILDGYRLLPFPARTAHALTVGMAETAIGIGILTEDFRTTAAIASIAVLSAYAVAIGFNLLRDRTEIDCGCSGPGRNQPISWHLVARNFLLAAMAAVTLIAAAERSLDWIDWLTTAIAGFLAVVIYQGTGVLLENQIKLNEMRRGA